MHLMIVVPSSVSRFSNSLIAPYLRSISSGVASSWTRTISTSS